MMRRNCALFAEAASGRKFQVAVVGGGPSGCYVAHHLLKKTAEAKNIHVDIFEKLPVPYGLSRYGVAPDHPEVKNVEKTFTEMFESKRASFLGNVTIGKDVTIPQLRARYDAVVVSTGASSDLHLNIPGEEKKGVISARSFVDYYNTLPDPYSNPKQCPVDLSQVEDVIIVGNGNVAMDCARVLAFPYKHWCSTDMNAQACKALYQSKVKTITIVARRGVEHSAFATKEFRELVNMDRDIVRVQDFDLEDVLKNKVDLKKDRPKKRQLELVHKYTFSEMAKQKALEAEERKKKEDAGESVPAEELSYYQKQSGRVIQFRYGLTPREFLPHKSAAGSVGSTAFLDTEQLKESNQKKQGSGEEEDNGGIDFRILKSELVIRSVGYKSLPIPGVPFDEQKSIIPNIQGRVEGEAGLYCSGWVKRGPKGVILQTMMDAQETAGVIMQDLERIDELLKAPEGEVQTLDEETVEALAPKFGKFELVQQMAEKMLMPVTMSAVKDIWNQEKERGIDLGKPSEKIPSCRTMVDIAIGGKVARDAKLKNRGFDNVRDHLGFLEDVLSKEDRLVVDPNTLLPGHTAAKKVRQGELPTTSASKADGDSS